MEQCGSTLSCRWQSVAVRLEDHRQDALPAITCLSITVCHNETAPLGTVWLLNSSNSQRPQGTNYFLKHWHDIFTQLLWIEQTWLGLKNNCLKKKLKRIHMWQAASSGTQSSDHQSQLHVADLCRRPSAAVEGLPAEAERPYTEQH